MREHDHVTVAAETSPMLQERLKEAIRREQETAKRIRLAQEAAEIRAAWQYRWRVFVTVGATVAMINFMSTVFSMIDEAKLRVTVTPIATLLHIKQENQP